MGHIVEMGCAATKVSDQQQNDDNNEEDGGGGDDVPLPIAPVSIEGDATVEVIPVPEGENGFPVPFGLSLYY